MEKKDCMKRSGFEARVMRRMLSVLFLLVCMGVNNLRADTIIEKVELSISVKEASVLHIFSLIKKQTSFNFVYNDKDISQIGLKTMDLKNVNISRGRIWFTSLWAMWLSSRNVLKLYEIV